MPWSLDLWNLVVLLFHVSSTHLSLEVGVPLWNLTYWVAVVDGGALSSAHKAHTRCLSLSTVSLHGNAPHCCTAILAGGCRQSSQPTPLSPVRALSHSGQESRDQLESQIRAAPGNPDAFHQHSICPLQLLNCRSGADTKQQADEIFYFKRV